MRNAENLVCPSPCSMHATAVLVSQFQSYGEAISRRPDELSHHDRPSYLPCLEVTSDIYCLLSRESRRNSSGCRSAHYKYCPSLGSHRFSFSSQCPIHFGQHTNRWPQYHTVEIRVRHMAGLGVGLPDYWAADTS